MTIERIPSTAPVSVGIVGAGAITRKSHLPVLASMVGVRVAWIYDQRPEAAAVLSRAYRVPAVTAVSLGRLPACDVVLLAVPADVREPYLREFSDRGTAVFCEKPFAMTARAHSDALALFASHALGVGFMRRYFRSAILLRRIVRDEMFGPLLEIDVSEGNRSKGSGADASFLDDPARGAARGVLVDLGSHSLDLALYVSRANGFEIRSCAQVLDGAVDRKVTATVLLHCDGESPAPVALKFGVSWLDRQENRIRLRFSHASVWAGLGPSAEVWVGDPSRPDEAFTLDGRAMGATTYNQAFFLEWENFLQGWRTRAESEVSARSAFLTTSLVEALLNAPGAAA